MDVESSICLSDLVPALRWSRPQQVAEALADPRLPASWWSSLALSRALGTAGLDWMCERLARLASSRWDHLALADMLPALVVHHIDPGLPGWPEPTRAAINGLGGWQRLRRLCPGDLATPSVAAEVVIGSVFREILGRVPEARPAPHPEITHPVQLPSQQSFPSGARPAAPSADRPQTGPLPAVPPLSAGSPAAASGARPHTGPLPAVPGDSPAGPPPTIPPYPADSPAAGTQPARPQTGPHPTVSPFQADSPAAASGAQPAGPQTGPHSTIPAAASGAQPAVPGDQPGALPRRPNGPLSAPPSAAGTSAPSHTGPVPSVPPSGPGSGAPSRTGSFSPSGAPPQTGSFPAIPTSGAAPQSGAFPAAGAPPQTGPFPAAGAPPQTGPFPAVPPSGASPQSGSFPASGSSGGGPHTGTFSAIPAAPGSQAFAGSGSPAVPSDTDHAMVRVVDSLFRSLDKLELAVAVHRLFAEDPVSLRTLAHKMLVDRDVLSQAQRTAEERILHWLRSSESAPVTGHMFRLTEWLGAAATQDQLIGADPAHPVSVPSLRSPLWRVLVTLMPDRRLQDGWLVVGDIHGLQERTRQLLAARRDSDPLELLAELGIRAHSAKAWLDALPAEAPSEPMAASAAPAPAQPLPRRTPGANGHHHRGGQPIPTAETGSIDPTAALATLSALSGGRPPVLPGLAGAPSTPPPPIPGPTSEPRRWQRIEVTPEHLRGGPVPVPEGYAAQLGMRPGTLLSVTGPGDNAIVLVWQGHQPVFDSLQPVLMRLNARPGDQVYVTVDGYRLEAQLTA
ncbi:hypothetical protein [Nonomuraea sediminis]|uniref:hypothetical protein n=1 Tax=Nonomuraea sediminis TaxID=2835864 RepID=UPI001BDC2C2B|nr:hypothetical protein [Nonomuraea sediminis]